MGWGWLAAGAALALGMAIKPGKQWPLWEGYASASIDEQGRVIDRQGGGRTTSEGQSYGLFFALAANDRDRFDRLLHWTSSNLAGGDLGTDLPAWLWGKDEGGQWKTLDPHSAADADLWIAYTLCEAGRLWREPRYGILGRRMMVRIAAGEVGELPGFGTMLLPGATGFHPTPDTWLLNPSYLPLPLLTRLAVIDPAGPWSRIAANVPLLLEQSARNGFVMDWLTYRPGSGFEPASLPGSSAPPGGSYDAIRVYLWAGLTDAGTRWGPRTLQAVPGMSSYLATQALPPEHISAAGTVGEGNAPIGFSAALLPYLQALGAKSALTTQAARVSAQLNAATHLYGQPPTYYDENLTLFGLGGRQQVFAFGRDGQLQVKW